MGYSRLWTSQIHNFFCLTKGWALPCFGCPDPIKSLGSLLSLVKIFDSTLQNMVAIQSTSMERQYMHGSQPWRNEDSRNIQSMDLCHCWCMEFPSWRTLTETSVCSCIGCWSSQKEAQEPKSGQGLGGKLNLKRAILGNRWYQGQRATKNIT